MNLLRTIFSIGSLFLSSVFANAGEIIEASVEHKNKQYFISIEAVINADSQRVYSMLTDYENLTQLSDSIEESQLVYSLSDNDHRVRVQTEACVTFFCKTINQVQDVEELPGMVIVTTSLPQKSDVDYAHARWKISSSNGFTHISFSSDLKPSFWVPPVIGPPLIERALRNEVISIIEGLETLAQ